MGRDCVHCGTRVSACSLAGPGVGDTPGETGGCGTEVGSTISTATRVDAVGGRTVGKGAVIGVTGSCVGVAVEADGSGVVTSSSVGADVAVIAVASPAPPPMSFPFPPPLVANCITTTATTAPRATNMATSTKSGRLLHIRLSIITSHCPVGGLRCPLAFRHRFTHRPAGHTCFIISSRLI